MKKTLAVVLGLAAAGGPAAAQTPPLAPAPTPANQPIAVARHDEAQLDQLLGPIALYPDALIALILPASTVPTDVVLAARLLRESPGDPAQIDNSPWDDSVKSLARYPDLLRWMDENLAWTQQLGAAFATQPADVMNTIQRLRSRARAAGTLVDTPQQQVIVQGNTISIVPAQPDIIYVPYYDPVVVYQTRPAFSTDPFFRFSPAYPTGFWLAYNMDWDHHRVWVVNRRDRDRYWRDHRNSWHRPPPSRPGGDPDRTPWTPAPERPITRTVLPPSSMTPLRPGAYTPPRRDDDRLRDDNRDRRPDVVRPSNPVSNPTRVQSPGRPGSVPQPPTDYVKPAPSTPLRSMPIPDRGGNRFGSDRSPRLNHDVPPPPVAPPITVPQPEPQTYSDPAGAAAPTPRQPPNSFPARDQGPDRAYGPRRDR